MTTLSIHDLAQRRELDHQALAAVRGGRSFTPSLGMGPLANVNVEVNQNIAQLQDIQVNALNNVGSIGPGFGPLSFDLSPKQSARTKVGV